jgi:hypothetical protein
MTNEMRSACRIVAGKSEEKVHFRDRGTKERIMLEWFCLFFK